MEFASYVVLNFFSSCSCECMHLANMIFFFTEMALMEYELVTVGPSLLAASAVYAARCTGACQDARHGSRRCPAEQAQGHLQEVLLRAVWACVPARPRSCPSTRPEKDLISCSYNLSYCRMHAP
ncbi:G2/mitotic-specific cyclin-2-like isoform X3 [Hordeum vulgare subsp. vulgare]|uniref:G2/mitotic-specific cyclin-2-like isoform X3 n=1 Tax=Hordeum vulgare subsp. vulgare TaxID=112509 RepID=UPI001D1A5896|nr:G2/mitotic-specific cyclin-2-like isoform X3 [Hordeum vulgare subsp. vulgare]